MRRTYILIPSNANECNKIFSLAFFLAIMSLLNAKNWIKMHEICSFSIFLYIILPNVRAPTQSNIQFICISQPLLDYIKSFLFVLPSQRIRTILHVPWTAALCYFLFTCPIILLSSTQRSINYCDCEQMWGCFDKESSERILGVQAVPQAPFCVWPPCSNLWEKHHYSRTNKEPQG